ncbi:MAG: DUF5683 domain-containing protein [Cyclobacteriaceae bacterium]
MRIVFCRLSLHPAKNSRRNTISSAVIFYAFFFMMLAGYQSNAQDSLIVERDTLVIDQGPDTIAIQSYARRYSPRKAILYAAILPGLGQIYNKKYWKLPLVYGGFYAIGYAINYYNGLHTEYKGYLFRNLEDGIGENEENPNLPQIRRTTGQLRTIVDKARRERDFMIILMGGMYILQMVDAHVDSHLKEFDLNPRLQVSIEPTMQQDAWTGRTTGVSLIFRF